MDEYYRTYIDNKLSNVALTRTIDWKELFQAIEDNYKQNPRIFLNHSVAYRRRYFIEGNI